MAARTEWRPGTRVRVRGRRWRIAEVTPAEDCAAIRLTSLSGQHPPEALTILTPFDRPIPLEAAPRIRVLRPRRWLHDLDRALIDIRPFGSLSAIAPSAIRVLPYQLEPALAILRDGSTRILVADGVGLGKTIQAGVILAELGARSETFRAIVLVPAGLRAQWLDELLTHFGVTAINTGSVWLRKVTSELPSSVNPWSLPGTYLASHDFVKRPEALRPLEDVTWDLVVVDEAHAASSRTDRRTAIDAIAIRSRRVILLTATPHAGDPGEFSSLCRIGRLSEDEPEPLIFARSRQDVDGLPGRKTAVLGVTPSEAESRMHDLLRRYSSLVWKQATSRGDERARLVSIILRKRALSSATSLAISINRRIALLAAPAPAETVQMTLRFEDEDPLEDDEPLGALAVPGLADAKRERRWLGTLAEAARVAGRLETKTRCLLRFLARVHEPVIIFTEYRDTLAHLQRRVAATGRTIAVLHGGMSPNERHEATRYFNHGAATLLATDAAAEGLNLHRRCRIVLHFELPWNPMRLEQRVGRVDRLGQNRRVHEVALVANATAEQLVIAPLITRAASARRAGHRSSLAETLTESRIGEIVMGDDVEQPPSSALATRAPSVTSVAATLEAERLERERAWRTRSSARSSRVRSEGVLVTRLNRSIHSDLEKGIALIFVVLIETDRGDRLHGGTVAFHASAGSHTPTMRAAADVRRVVREYLQPVHPDLRAALDRATTEAQLEITERYQRARASDAEREQRISALRASAAQQLVQPGLFDRHSGRRDGQCDRGRDDWCEAIAAAPLQASVRLLAALVVGAATK